jgi:RecB family exonuclease
MPYKLSPSSSSRFLTCSASLKHNQGFSENETTLKGSLQHEVAYLMLDEYFNENDNQEKIAFLKDYNNWFESKERKEIKVHWEKDYELTVQNYVNYVKTLFMQFKPKQVLLEYKIKMSFYGNEVNGTADCVMILENNDIIIVDLKTGRSKVEVEDNSQMLMYAYGVAQDIFRKTNKLAQKVIISIHQNLIHNTKAISYDMKDLIEWFVSKSVVMEEINSDKLVYRPSKIACRFCQHKFKCNERIKKGIVV